MTYKLFKEDCKQLLYQSTDVSTFAQKHSCDVNFANNISTFLKDKADSSIFYELKHLAILCRRCRYSALYLPDDYIQEDLVAKDTYLKQLQVKYSFYIELIEDIGWHLAETCSLGLSY